MNFKNVRIIDDEDVDHKDIQNDNTDSINNNEVIETQEVDTGETEEEPTGIDDNTLFLELSKRTGREISSMDELFVEKIVEKESVLPEDVDAFLKYKRETGRGLKDFFELQKDYDSIDEDKLLYDFIKENSPNLDDDLIKHKMKEFSFDAELDDDDHINEVKIKRKEALHKAKSYFEERKEKYKAPLESRDGFIPEDEKEAYTAFKQSKEQSEKIHEENLKRSQTFLNKTNDFLNDKFEGFGVSLSEDKKVLYKPAEANSIKERQMNINNFISKFLDQEGFLKDAESFHKAIAIADDPDKFARFCYEQGKADAVKDIEKDAKNIDLERKTPDSKKPVSGPKIRIVEDNRSDKVTFKK